MPRRLPGRAIQAGTITVTQLETSVATTVQTGGGPKITTVQVTSNSYVVLDDTAVDIAGGYIKITGTGFAAGCQVLINNTPATSTTYIGPTEVRAQLPATAAGTYMLYLINADGGVAIRVNGVTFSATPSWVTASDLTSYALGDAISIQLSATGASTFALAAGSTLPTGLTLSAGGLLSGSVTGLENDTSYSFTITAIDAENQDSPRTFSITITVQLQVSRSLRFNRADTAYLTRTFAVNGDRQRWTWSSWIKRSGLGTLQNIINSVNVTPIDGFYFDTNDTLKYRSYNGTSETVQVVTTQVFRDTSSWYHLVVALDTTQATAANRLRMYINGSEITAFSTATYPTQNFLTGINLAGTTELGSYAVNNTFNGYMTEVYFIDGQQLTPAAFAETNNSTGQYIPKKYTGTYGTNGFYLPFTDNSSVLNLGRNYQPLTADPFWPQTVLLLNGTGTNNANNNTFIDSSTNAFAITRNGNTTQGRFSPFSQTGWGNYFSGGANYLSVAATTSIDLASSDFTIECWAYPGTQTNSVDSVFGYGNFTTMLYRNGTTWSWEVGNGSSANYFTITATVTPNTWQHIALTRSGNTFTFWKNGSLAGTNSTANAVGTASKSLRIGDTGGGTENFTGYISNFRITKGRAVYTSAFTPPTTPLTRTTGGTNPPQGTECSLLTCQSNRFLDSNGVNIPASSPLTITASGSPTVVAFSPFNPSTSWSAATNGGSAYFDGTGDYLTAASNAAFAFGTGEFTYETWFYCKGANSSDQLFYDLGSANTAGSFSVFTSLSVLTVRIGGLGNDLTYNLTSSWPNQWHHLAIVRNSSNVLTIYLDGTSIASGTRAQDVTQSSPYIGVGAGVLAGYNYSGYFSNTRVVKGTAVYTGTFTPPSLAPLTNTGSTSAAAYPSTTNVNTSFAISATSLLLNFVNAGIVDATGDNNIETVGDAKISTAQSKWAGSSMLFDGTGDNLFIGSGARNFSLGTSDFTIECWFRHNGAQNSDSAIFSFSNANFFVCHNNATSYNNLITVWIDPYSSGLRALTGTTTLVDATWYHLAISRAGGVWRLFLNGVQEATYTNSADPLPAGAYLTIGSRQTGSLYYKGYIQDFRITLAARYTGNFTPPTAQFAYNQGDINYNQWVPTNFSVTAGAGNDSLLDVPTNWGVDTGLGGEVRGNYCVLNPLWTYNGPTLSNGSLDIATSSGSWKNAHGTFGITTGKWYWESTMSGTQFFVVGVGISAGVSTEYGTSEGNSWTYDGRAYKLGNAAGSNISYGATFGNGDIIGVALDMDVGTLTFYKNGVSQGVAFSTGLAGKTLFPQFGVYASGTTSQSVNFGQRPFAYTAPSGFKSLNTHNLPALAVTKSNTAFDTVLYTGDGTNSRTITSSLGFTPDLVWGKSRSIDNWHVLVDSVRGNYKILSSNATNAETPINSYNLSTANSLIAWNSNETNQNGTTYAAWLWKANGAGSTNTTGSITSTVSVNTTSGFSIVSWTGTGAVGTIGHNLGVAPSMIIVKARSTTDAWYVYHVSRGPTIRIQLNETSAETSGTTVWNSTSPTSTVFSIGNGNPNSSAVTYVAYCFAAIPGFSAFGSYTGNGSADGPFVYTGFRPALIIAKQSSGAGQNWYIIDNKRGSYNVVDKLLNPNSSAIEETYSQVDFLSNGFKIRNTGLGMNASGATMIYAAFAESPFKYARAR